MTIKPVADNTHGSVVSVKVAAAFVCVKVAYVISIWVAIAFISLTVA